MRSWDFFDTLLGRACGEPWRVFELLGGEEFKNLRQQAEQKSDKTFAGIYQALRQLTNWPQERVDELQAAEWEWERRLAFPIVENVQAVKENDLVITDTYFDAQQIRALADRIALPAVDVIATYGGKHHGTVWKNLRRAARKPATHTGDNRHADYDQARRFGFSAVNYRAGDATGIEKTLSTAGHWDVAGLSRCVRLQNPYRRPAPAWSVWQKQAQYNIPFLLLCAARLKQYVLEHNHKHVWFLSRDTCLLQRVFAALYPDISAETFYASRQTYTQPSAEFIAYTQAALSRPRPLFVDLQGTGKSVREFSDATQLSLPYVYCAMPRRLAAFSPALYSLEFIGTELEVLNYDVHGRVIDVRNGQPVRAPLEYDKKAAQASHAAVDCLLRHIFRPPGLPTDALMTQVFQQVRRHAPRELIRQHQAHHPIIEPKE
jgi:FMN phosphatase YigB (HAD superfamily)